MSDGGILTFKSLYFETVSGLYGAPGLRLGLSTVDEHGYLLKTFPLGDSQILVFWKRKMREISGCVFWNRNM